MVTAASRSIRNRIELLEMQRGGVRVKASDLRPSLSEEADGLFCTPSFDPNERFQSARELGDALARTLASGTVTLDQRLSLQAQIPATQLATDAIPPALQTADLSSKTIAVHMSPPSSHPRWSRLSECAAQTSPFGKPWLKIAVVLILIAAIAGGASVLIWKRNALFGKKEVAASVPQRSLNYSLTVQKMRDGKSYQDTFESSGQEIFENGWKFRLNLSSPQEGYLYLLTKARPPAMRPPTICCPGSEDQQ